MAKKLVASTSNSAEGLRDFADVQVNLSDYLPAEQLETMSALEQRACRNKIENYEVLKKLGKLKLYKWIELVEMIFDFTAGSNFNLNFIFAFKYKIMTMVRCSCYFAVVHVLYADGVCCVQLCIHR